MCIDSFREGWYGFWKPQCGDPENWITVCKINSIKKRKLKSTSIYNKCINTHFIISDQNYWFWFFLESCENAGAFWKYTLFKMHCSKLNYSNACVSKVNGLYYQFIPSQYTTVCWFVCSSWCNVRTCKKYDLTLTIRLHGFMNKYITVYLEITLQKIHS